MPSGREAFGGNPGRWGPKLLGEDDLARMRAPIDVGDRLGEEQSSGDEVIDDAGVERAASKAPARAFPGARGPHEDNF